MSVLTHHKKLTILVVLTLALVFLLLVSVPAGAAPGATMSRMPSYCAYVNPFTYFMNPFTYFVNPYSYYYNPFGG